MAAKDNKTECTVTCWGIAALVGFLAMVLLYWMADFDAMQAIFTGGLIGTVLGLILMFTVCSSQTAADDLGSDNKPASRYAAEAAQRSGGTSAAHSSGSAPTAGAAAGDAGVDAGTAGAMAGTAGAAPAQASAAATSQTAKTSGGTTANQSSGTSAPAGSAADGAATPSAAMNMPSGDAQTASASGNSGAKTSAKAKPASKAKAVNGATSTTGTKAAPKAKAAPKSKPAASAKTPAASAATGASAGSAAPASDGSEASKPDTMLSQARAGGADDLKLISGVGPKLEQTLNDLGVYHFDQVAKWGPSDIAWVDANLRFKGRIERDDWMSQARTLADGGETEFSRKKKKT